MPLRMAVTKVSGQGEQLVIDVCQWNPVTGELLHSVDEISELYEKACRIADLRLLDMNTRTIEVSQLRQHFDAENWMKVVSILDILAGRQSVDMVLQRWHDTAEENAELDTMRQAAFTNKYHNNDSYCDACNEKNGYHVAGCEYAKVD